MLRKWLVGLLVVLVVAPVALAQSEPCSMAQLPGLSRKFAPMSGGKEATAAGDAADFARVAGSILGETAVAGVDWPTRGDLPCDAGVRQRDHLAWQMASVGYSAKEIADVLDGHLTRADLDQARARLMAGEPRTRVADFLDARWREPAVEMIARRPDPAAPVFGEIDAALSVMAEQHGVPAALVRAMIAAESGGNARARSSAGAIGLMQLMPATAAALGVDPWHPLENLRGGITYMAGLLRAYHGDPRLALIAYNAGPQHANRVRAGQAVAYRETRKYLSAIDAMYPLP